MSRDSNRTVKVVVDPEYRAPDHGMELPAFVGDLIVKVERIEERARTLVLGTQ